MPEMTLNCGTKMFLFYFEHVIA